MSERGRLLVLEGPDGIGKSTAATALAASLQAAGESCLKLEFPGSHPGSLGALVYELHHNPAKVGIEKVSPLALQAMHVAAHVDAIFSTIRPHIEAGSSVVLDRYWWSTHVYGLRAGIVEPTLRKLIDFERSCWDDLLPAMVFVLDRESPWRDAEAGPAWTDLRAGYLILAEEQRVAHPVEVVCNDSSPEALIAKLITLLTGAA